MTSLAGKKKIMNNLSKYKKEFEKKFVNKKVAHDEWDDENRSTIVECDDWKYDALPTKAWSFIEKALESERKTYEKEFKDYLKTSKSVNNGYKEALKEKIEGIKWIQNGYTDPKGLEIHNQAIDDILKQL